MRALPVALTSLAAAVASSNAPAEMMNLRNSLGFTLLSSHTQKSKSLPRIYLGILSRWRRLRPCIASNLFHHPQAIL
jgi:hypothetical protein